MSQKASFLTAAVLSLAVLTACNNNNEAAETAAAGDAPGADSAMVDDPTATATENDPLLAEGASAPATTVNEGDALGMVIAVDEHEIAAAEQAKSKNVSAPVAAYADMMIKEHTAHMEKARALEGSAKVQIGTGPQVASLRTDSEAARNRLANMQGQDFERAYVEEMVNSHQKTLTMLESQLVPAAQNEALRTFLTQTRDTVAKHLEAARQLQTQIGGAANAAAAPTRS
jgi:putative membrane protein